VVLSQLEAGVETRSGALLTGARGSGKTTWARAAYDELAPGFERAAWITGTAADSRVPFGAFERLFTVPETGRTVQVLSAAREALGTGLPLVVDDGHLLDRLSASLVYQLAVSGAARVIVTAESNQSLPEGISALVRDRLVVPVAADGPVPPVASPAADPPPAPDDDGVVGRLRRAVGALEGGDALPVAELAAAADDALRLGDLELAERLGRAALPAGGLATRVTLSYALAWQGRGPDADAVLAEVDATALTEPALLMWALPRAANQFWMLSEPERATMNAGNLNRAMQLADSVLSSPDPSDTAVGWAASAAALSCARTGRLTEVDGFAERALAAGQPGLLRFTSGFGQTTALLLAGEPDTAQRLARELIDFTQSQQPGRAIGEVLLADVLISRGELDSAIELLENAAKALARTGYSWGPLAWMLLARALGQRGATAEAGRALARAEARHGLKSMLFAPELALARAWTNAARRDRHGAIAAAREAFRAAQRGGQSAVALRALHDAALLGDVRAADCFGRVGVDCAFARQARTLAAEVAAGRT